MQVTDRELGALDVHRQVDFTAAREILDIAVAAVLGSAGDGARPFLADLILDVVAAAADVHVRGVGWEGDVPAHVRAFFD